MKEILKIISVILIILSLVIGIMALIEINNENQVYAAGGSQASDLQLMARAINGEARGEPYEGQVAVRSSYTKSCKKFKFS